MYLKQETAKLKQEFWTAFGQYMSPILSAEGGHINWINYKTGEKDIFFRINADNKIALIAIEITHKDEALQELYFNQFEQLKTLLQSTMGEEWKWILHTHDSNGKTISRIYASIENVNIFNKEDWPKLISFFKPRLIALDEFWINAKQIFEALR
ncbi:MAG: DUF4268 domain-containing protein [Parafilimonas sp.]|nr:DUF4268 domain-containing protein [Parafilimonas sp.]